MRFGGINVSFPQAKRQPQFVDNAFRDGDLDALAINENRRRAKAYRPRKMVAGKQPEGYSSQALILPHNTKVVGRGSRQAFTGRFGQKIDWRRHVWAVIRHLDFTGPIALISSHAPPRYMWFTGINELYARSLRKAVARQIRMGREVVLYLDANAARRHGDVYRLRSVGLRQVAGKRIDQIWVSDGIEAVATREVDQRRYGRHDDHPLVVADLRSRDAGTYTARTDTLKES